MTRELIYAHVSAVLSTLLEVGEPAPESSLYLAMESNIERYHMIRNLMIDSGLISVEHNAVSLTEKGREVAERCDKVLRGSVGVPPPAKNTAKGLQWVLIRTMKKGTKRLYIWTPAHEWRRLPAKCKKLPFEVYSWNSKEDAEHYLKMDTFAPKTECKIAPLVLGGKQVIMV